MLRSLVVAGLLSSPLAALASSSAKEFTAQDLLSAPRPQPAIPDEHGTQALSVVDQWDPESDK